MTIEDLEQTARTIKSHPWHLLSIILILGMAGIFLQPFLIFTTLSLLLSVTIIPGFVLVYSADQALIKKNPIIAISASILISITILIIYVLICEIVQVPMTVSPGVPSKAGVLFQTGIILYTAICLLIAGICSRIIPGYQAGPSERILSTGISLPVTIIILIITGITCYAGILLSESNPEPTTELFFADNPGHSVNGRIIPEQATGITIINHEKRTVPYILNITIQGSDLITIPTDLKDGESYQTEIPLYNETTGMKNRPLLVRLYDDQSRERPYREIWREQ